jgi:beta-galactosidase
VYSNQPEVSLYLNGELVETKTADSVFKFKVTLNDGENKLEVKAANLADEAVIIRSDEDHPEYIAPKVDTKNWF